MIGWLTWMLGGVVGVIACVVVLSIITAAYNALPKQRHKRCLQNIGRLESELCPDTPRELRWAPWPRDSVPELLHMYGYGPGHRWPVASNYHQIIRSSSVQHYNTTENRPSTLTEIEAFHERVQVTAHERMQQMQQMQQRAH